MMSAVFYPGVSERIKATTIEINAGETQSNISFKVPVQNTYSVRGIISTNDKSGLDSRSVYVSLVSLDGGPFYLGTACQSTSKVHSLFRRSNPLISRTFFPVVTWRMFLYLARVGTQRRKK